MSSTQRESDPSRAAPATRSVRVWDVPVRLCHWSLVVLLAVCWYTGETSGVDEMTWHMRCGYAVLGMVVFRLLWGFVGSSTARFTHFLRGPRATLASVAELIRLRPPSPIGHSPLGGWMIAALLACLLTQAVTGLFASDEVMTEGPLSHRVTGATVAFLTTVHKWNFELLLVLVGTHVAAVLFHLLVLRANLILPMLTGRKCIPADTPDPALNFAGPGTTVLVAAVAAGAVYLLVR